MIRINEYDTAINKYVEVFSALCSLNTNSFKIMMSLGNDSNILVEADPEIMAPYLDQFVAENIYKKETYKRDTLELIVRSYKEHYIDKKQFYYKKSNDLEVNNLHHSFITRITMYLLH